MINETLGTKLGRIAPARGLLPRQAFLAKYLGQWQERRMCSVVAPAGYGKSSALFLARQALIDKGVATSWVSLDEDDNEPVRLIAAIASALDESCPGVAKRALSQLEHGALPSLRPVLAMLLEDFAALGIPVVFFLDDVHALVESSSLALIERLIHRAPPLLRFVCAGRAPLAAVQAVLRVQGEMLEFGLDDLALSRDEVRALAKLHGAELGDGGGDGVVAHVHSTTEGWVAGAQLFFLAASTHDEMAHLLQAFDGTDRSVSDYLASAVLKRQTPETQQFLLTTAVLERMSAPLCTALVPSVNGQAMLEQLESAGLFLIPLDRNRQWFRYHHLFRDFLRAQLNLLRPGARSKLQRQASDWCLSNGLRHDAIAYAMAASDFDTAATLIAEDAEQIALHHGDHSTLLRWVGGLPESCLEQWPRIRVSLAWSMTFTHQHARALQELDKAEAAAQRSVAGAAARPASEPTPVRQMSEMIRCVLDALQDRSTQARVNCLQWFASWPNAPDFNAGTVSNALAYACLCSSAFDRGIAECERARAAFTRCDSHYGIAWATAIHGMLLAAQGNLKAAKRLLVEGLDRSRRSWGIHSHASSLLALTLAEVLFEANELDRANRALDEGRLAMEDIATCEFVYIARSVRARMLVLKGAQVEAVYELAQGRRQARDLDLPRLYSLLLLDELRVHLRAERWRDAEAAHSALCAETEAAANASDHAAVLSDLRLQADAWLCTSRDRPKEAMRAWGQVIAGARRSGDTKLLITALLQRALLLWQEGSANDSLRTLSEVMVTGLRGGFFRTLVEERARIVPLLVRFVAERAPAGSTGTSDELDYAREILLACEVSSEELAKAQPAAQAAIESVSLTRKEIALLRLAGQGLSNSALASALFVAEPTVKWHMHNIFGKLGVRNRVAALAKARTLGWIE